MKDPEHLELKASITELHIKVDDISNRMFVDNGTPSHQTRLDRLDRICKVGCWVVGIIGVVIVKDLATSIFRLLAAQAYAGGAIP